MTTTPNPSQVDRLDGVDDGLFGFFFNDTATTENITLSGEQTIDTVDVVADDRVLVKDQDDLTENGLYDVSTGNWRRALDANGNRDLRKGTQVRVTEGSDNIRTTWECISDDPILFDTSEIEWQLVTGGSGGGGGGFPNATYVTVEDESADLPNSRQLTAGTGILITDGGAGNPITIATTTNFRNSGLFYEIDGGGSAITTGIKGAGMRVPFNCTITGVTLAADQTGSIVVDIWKDTYANYPPTGADSICAAAKPTISAAEKSQDLTLTGWTTALTAGDMIRFNVDSCSTITLCDINVHVRAT